MTGYDYINFSCTLSSVYGTPGLYTDLAACENAVEDGIAKSVLILTPLWSATKKASLPLLTNKLGDGYQQIVFKGFNQISEEWSITSPVLVGTQVDQLLNQLRQLSSTSFLWSPNNGVIDYQEFTCDDWQKTKLGVNQYQINTTFKMAILGSGLLVPEIVSPPTSSDPYANNVVLYLRGDGTNGSTSIVDSSPNPKTISVFGNAQISTAQSKYGGSSLYFDGVTDALLAPNTDIADSANATVEGWVYLFSVTPNQGIFSKFLYTGNFSGWGVRCSNGVILVFNSSTNPFIQTAAVLQPNVFTHIALSKQGTLIKVFVNGVLVGSATQELAVTSNDFLIGAMYNTSLVESLNGYIDSFRLTRGICRYTANFNPETDTYLNV